MSGIFRPGVFVKANTPGEVIEAQRKYGGRARVVGGFTYLNELAKRNLLGDVDALIDIEPLGLRYIRMNGSLEIGASARIEDIAQNAGIENDRSLRAISLAARSVHPPQVRNTATVAGCISTGLSFLDLPVALMALDARVIIAGEGKDEDVSMEEYILQIFSQTKPGFVKELRVERNTSKGSSSFRKFAVTGTDYAVANSAVRMVKDGLGRCSMCSIVVGGSGIELQRLSEAEAIVVGKKPSEDAFVESARTAASRASVTDDIPVRGTADYKRRILNVVVKGALRDAAIGA